MNRIKVPSYAKEAARKGLEERKLNKRKVMLLFYLKCLGVEYEKH